jgi:S1-C subfamily serine protease
VAHKDSGIDMQVSGKSGQFVIKLPPEYVQGFLQKFDETLTRVSFGTTPRSSPTAVTGKGSLGVKILPVPPQMAGVLGTDPGKGVIVLRTTEGSPADAAGMKPGDVILTFGGTEVNSPEALQAAVKGATDHAAVTVWRAKAKVDLDVKFQ